MPRSGIGLTSRGVTLLLCGLAVAIAAAWFGEPDLVWLGVFLAALPLVGYLAVFLTRPRLTVERNISPAEAPIGSSPRASLTIRNRAPLSLSTLEFRDSIPRKLGHDARFNLTRGFGPWKQTASYSVPATQRGHYHIGPLYARSYDPFGMAVASWRVRGDETSLRVIPRIFEIEKIVGGVSSGSSSESTPQRIGQAGQDDVLVREHRHGDDMRRVHWRMSAKMGELMVRLEEHPWDPSLTLLIDNRNSAHFGSGPDSTLEWGISAAASVGNDLLSNRFRVTMLSADDLVFTPQHGDPMANKQGMIRALTDLQGTSRTTLDTGLTEWEALTSSHTLLAVMGLLTREDATVLAGIGTHMLQAMALVPDAASWGATTEQYDEHREAVRFLTAHGWEIDRYRTREQVPEAWSALMRRKQAR